MIFSADCPASKLVALKVEDNLLIKEVEANDNSDMEISLVSEFSLYFISAVINGVLSRLRVPVTGVHCS